MITKTSYLNFKICSRNLWLSIFKKEVAVPLSELGKKNIETGIALGKYARSYFPDTYSASRLNQDGKIDPDAQILATQEAIRSNYHAIAEASFKYDDLFCAVDLLVSEDGGYSIYEVKASSKYKEEHLFDITFQAYVLRKCGLNIKHCFLMHINSAYIRHGDIDVHQLLAIDDISDHGDITSSLANIEDDLLQMRKILSSKNEWKIEFSAECKECPFHDYCTAKLPKNNIATIHGFGAREAYTLINQGIITAQDYVANGFSFTHKRKQKQLESMIKDTGVYVDQIALSHFLNQIHYPLYHLDFETMNEGIPPFDNTHPFEQIPFQYSLHVEHTKGNDYIHKEFLGNQLDSRREIAVQLCADIPIGAMSIAYHASFEKGVLTGLGELFPDLKSHLLSIRDHMIDLELPFSKAYYFDPKQGGSNSIKYVMPALCPHMKDEYDQLPVVHNGGEALAMFPKLVNMIGSERERMRQGMLSYCKLDTLSMVEVLKVLYKAIN